MDKALAMMAQVGERCHVSLCYMSPPIPPSINAGGSWET